VSTSVVVKTVSADWIEEVKATKCGANRELVSRNIVKARSSWSVVSEGVVCGWGCNGDGILRKHR
jgi:hypothetical protein